MQSTFVEEANEDNAKQGPFCLFPKPFVFSKTLLKCLKDVDILVNFT